jgi:peroxiredoxin Q/BCP
MRSASWSFVIPAWLAAAALPTSHAAAQQAPIAPNVGDMAPDFTLQAAGRSGVSAPVRLADHKGEVIVIAFYPGDNTTGCTAELGKFRDEYHAIFGDEVAVLPISADGLDSHQHWDADMKFPFALLSDTTQTVASLYGSALPGRKFDTRTVFVVGRDGRITYRNLTFNALSESAYSALTQAIAAAKSR